MTPAAGPGGRRVLLLLHGFSVGGAEIVVLNLALALRDAGWHPIACGWADGGPLIARFVAAGIPVEAPVRHPRGIGRLGVVRRLRRIAARHRVDIVHAHLSDAAILGVILQATGGPPCVVTHHSNDMIDTMGAGRPLYAAARLALLRVAARRATANIAVAEPVRARLIEGTGLDPDRIVTIGNGIPMPAAPAVDAAIAARFARWRSGDPTPSPGLVFVGRLHERKNVGLAIDGFASVLNARPAATLTILGDGPERAALEARAAGLGITGRVRFAGAVADVGPALDQADLFVSPSELEGLPLAVLEAMSRGVPVVLTDIPGHRELARGPDGEHGVLVPLGRPDRLADAVLGTLSDAAAAETRTRRAAGFVRAAYGADAMAARHIALYEAVLDRSGRRAAGV